MNSKRMRVGLRVLSNPAWMGGIHYVLNWLKALNLLPEDEKPDIYLLFWDERGEAIAKEHAHLVTAIKPFTEAALLDLDIVYPVTQIFEAPFQSPWAGWIPDWQCKYMPEMFDEIEIARRDLQHRLLATKAPFLVLSSQMAFDDTLRFIGDEHVPMEKLPFPAVIDEKYYDITEKEISQTLSKFNIPTRFFLVCNQFWKHKNHLVVFKALAELKDPSIICVFTGDTTDHRWPEYFNEIEKFILEHGLSSSVRLLGRISREEQLKLMMAAVAIIQPSRFEGWSTVVEESKSMGKPLILSRFPVHIEQAANESYFFDPDNYEDLAVSMKKIWDAPSAQITHEHRQRHKDYIIGCARRFMQISRQTRSNYRQDVHDPKYILIDLLRNLEETSSNVKEQIYQRAFEGTRIMLMNQPEQLVRFMEIISESCPEFYEKAKSEILLRVLFKMSEVLTNLKKSLVKSGEKNKARLELIRKHEAKMAELKALYDKTEEDSKARLELIFKHEARMAKLSKELKHWKQEATSWRGIGRLLLRKIRT